INSLVLRGLIAGRFQSQCLNKSTPIQNGVEGSLVEAGVNHFAVDVYVPMSMPRRLFAWWIAQIKHVLPPTIFFFVGFNLILWTKQLILKEHGIDFSGFITATFAALLIGKAVLVTDNLPLMHRFDGAPLIRPILFKTAIYWVCVSVVRIGEALI